MGALLAVAGTAVAARLELELPATAVPLSAQTLAVLASGILLGARWGGVAMVGYLLAGSLGLPVFAGGGAGLEHLLGVTGGYLIGFVAAAMLAGWWVDRGLAERIPGAVVGMLTAHAVILVSGWCRLALELGPGAAFETGVAPFLVGGLVKSLLVAALAVGLQRLRDRHSPPALETESKRGRSEIASP